MITELKTIHDTRKSFYSKANVLNQNGKMILLSYNTEVCFIENGNAFIKDFHSNTTTRHIKEFLLQNGFRADNKKQMQDYLILAEYI